MSPAHHICDDALGVPAPGAANVLVTRLMLHGLLGGAYRRFVDGMGLSGDERVLDYGSGSGAVARHIAKRLRAGGGRLTSILHEHPCGGADWAFKDPPEQGYCGLSERANPAQEDHRAGERYHAAAPR